jgi:hypothetical protein
MRNNLFKVCIIIGIFIILNGIISGISLYKLKPLNNFINITPEEA